MADAVALDELLDRPGLVALMVDGGFGEVGVAQVADGGSELGGAGGEFLERLGLGEAAVVGVETGVAGVDDLVGKWGPHAREHRLQDQALDVIAAGDVADHGLYVATLVGAVPLPFLVGAGLDESHHALVRCIQPSRQSLG